MSMKIYLTALVAMFLFSFCLISSPLRAADCNNNGIDDADDISSGFSQDCNNNGVPDECDLLPTEISKPTASDAAENDCFGHSVSISGYVAVIGAPYDVEGAINSGSAYIFRWDGSNWVEHSKLTASDAEADDRFGKSVSISGLVAVIGAPYDDNAGSTSGSAYIFRRIGINWVEQAKLTASDAAEGDRFGYSVSIDGDVAVIGSFGDDEYSGSAYVFRWDGANWVEEAKLTASDAAADNWFGWSVSISGEVAVIGAYLDDDAGGLSGSAYVFRWDGANWVEEAKLTASDATAGDRFGYSVSIDGEVAVIGAYLDDDAASNSGSAYVFRWDGANWVEEAELTASDAAVNDYFGRSVSISGEVAVIGAPYDDTRGNNTGSAYVFRWDGANWVERPRLTASDAEGGDLFSYSVSISGERAMIGAYGNDDAGNNSGAVYVYLHQPASEDCNVNGVPDECEPDCNNNSVPDDWDISQDTSQDCNGNGVPDECDLLPTEQAKLIASDAEGGDYFGYSVSISGNLAVIGAFGNGDAGNNSGSAYVFRWDGANWVEQSKLTASDAAEDDWFGYSVSISGDLAVIGAPNDNDAGSKSGSAYVFRWDGSNWVEQAKLTASDAAADDWFGDSVSISGDLAVITASEDDGGSGSAYVFRWDGANWVEQAKLTASDAAAEDYFGSSVSISGDVVVVGAYGNDDAGVYSGSAYVFRWDGANWVEQSKLTASDAAANDIFGLSVSISGNLAVIGAFRNDDAGNDSGSAYVFRWDGAHWVEQSKLTASDAAAEDWFGYSVSISGDLVVIGASGDDGGSGSAYVFRWDGANWVEQAKLTASDAAAFDEFGYSVAIDGDVAVIGAYQDDDGGDYSGSAYIFQTTSQDCNINDVPDECETDSDGDGVPDDCDACPNTIPGSPVDASGCPPLIPGDYDRDGDVDTDDYDAFESCASGPAIPYSGDCAAKDFDGDNDVDQNDFAVFQRCYSGENNPGDPNCAD
jgi:hypothetical protein